MQSIARFVAQRPNEAGGIVRQGIRMMLVIGGLMTVRLSYSVHGLPTAAESRFGQWI